MNISDYRVQFASFNSALELARYSRHIGATPELDSDEVFDRYSDLFSEVALGDLQAKLDETPASYETERSGLQRLLNSARVAQVEMQGNESARELAYCESSSQVAWDGEMIAVADVPARLAGEANGRMRADLAARWGDTISSCDEVRLTRLRSLTEISNELGFASYGVLIAEATNAQSEHREMAATALLEQTESAYTAAFSRVAARGFPDVAADDLDFADLPYFERMPWLGKSLSSRDPMRTYADTMEGLGIRIDKQPNVQLDTNGHSRAACYPVRPPHDVRLLASPRDDAARFVDFLQQIGKAQQHAWCSRDLARRHPEFIYSLDTATNDGYGYLFSCLALEPRWLLEFLPDIDAVQAARIARDVAQRLVVKVRRLCAEALYSMVLHDGGRSSPERLQSTYIDLQERAISFRALPELFLLDRHERMEPQSHLRGLAFSFGLREYLRVRYGHAWWRSRKAGDELIDLWNTASQYSVEELARLIGFGELSFELLAESMITALKGA
jgi:hypothetical protein